MQLPAIATLWIEGALGPIERLSLTSFAAAGHEVTLYAYGEIVGLPGGVKLGNAAEIVPLAEAEAHRYPNGSYALFSNLFRYELLRRALGIWVDTDVVCLKPLALDLQFIAGWESNRYINGAVLHLDPHSPFLADAVGAFRSRRIPPWVPFNRAPLAFLKELAGHVVLPRELPHGTFGPKGVTALARQHGLAAMAQPPDVFYPVHPRRAREIFEAGLRLEEVVTERTLTVHLWNEKLKGLRSTSPAPGSVLRELFERYGI